MQQLCAASNEEGLQVQHFSLKDYMHLNESVVIVTLPKMNNRITVTFLESL